MNTFAQSQAQTQAHTVLTAKQVWRYFHSDQYTRVAGWLTAIGAGLLIAGAYLLIAGSLPNLIWLWLAFVMIGLITGIAGGGYWYYLYRYTPTDQDYDAHIKMLGSALYYKALRRLSIHQPDRYDHPFIQSYVMPGMPEVRTHRVQNLQVKVRGDHICSSFCKFTFIFVNAVSISKYEGYADAFDGALYEGETPRQYRFSSVQSIEAIHITKRTSVKLGEETGRYWQEEMALELTNGGRIPIIIYASPIGGVFPSFFATPEREARTAYDTICSWFQQ